MGLVTDLRDFLAAAGTPAGEYVWYTQAPAELPVAQPYVTLELETSDRQHSADPEGGYANAVIKVVCSVKGTDQAAQYAAADALAESVKEKLYEIIRRNQWPYFMGDSVIYYLSIQSECEKAASKGKYALPYQVHKGAESGTQAIVVPVAIQFFDPYG